MDRHDIHMRHVRMQARIRVAIILSITLCLVAHPAMGWASEQDGGVPADVAQAPIYAESAGAASQSEAASADTIQPSSEDEAAAQGPCETSADGDAQRESDGETPTQAPDEASEQANCSVRPPDNTTWTADVPDAAANGFAYAHDPRDNPKAMADIIEDTDAVYGFKPSTDGSLASYAEMDWTDSALVERGRQERIAYHESIADMYKMLYYMQATGATTEQIARAVSAKRNEIRIASYANDPEGLAKLKARNLELYGNENGGSPEYFYNRYGSWETVIDKSFSTNSGMDACLGLYDDYFALYVILGQVGPDPVEEDDEPDDSQQAGDRDAGKEHDEPTDERRTHAVTVTTHAGRRTSSASVQPAAHATQALPATGDAAALPPLGLALAGVLLVGLGLGAWQGDGSVDRQGDRGRGTVLSTH